MARGNPCECAAVLYVLDVSLHISVRFATHQPRSNKLYLTKHYIRRSILLLRNNHEEARRWKRHHPTGWVLIPRTADWFIVHRMR